MPVSSTEWMIPAVHPFSAESGPHEIRGPVIIDVNWRNTPNITSCATLSGEGVCNNKQISKYHEKNVVLPSHMRVSATTTTINMVDFLSCPILSYEGVCNLLLFRRWARTRSCPTLSYEGVCNEIMKTMAFLFLLSYPLIWGCLQLCVGYYAE